MTGNEVYIKKYQDKINNILKEFGQDYLYGYSNIISLDRSCSTVYAYTNNVIKFLKTINKEPKDLTENDYVSYIVSHQGKSSSYQITIYAALRAFSEWCKGKITTEDVMANVKMPKRIESIETEEKREVGYLTDSEIKKYVKNINENVGNGKSVSYNKKWHDRDLCIVMLLLNTGMRCSALYKLDINSIDFKNGTLRTVDKGRKIEKHYLSDQLMNCIKNWIKVRNSLPIDDKEKALFVSRDYKRLSQHGISNIIKKYSIDISDKKMTPHKLRATYGTQIYAVTHDIFAVQQCMGHASASTSAIYIRGQHNENREKAAQIMANLTF